MSHIFKIELDEIENDNYGYLSNMIMTIGSDTFYTKYNFLIRFDDLDIEEINKIILELNKDTFEFCNFDMTNTLLEIKRNNNNLIIIPTLNDSISDHIEICIPYNIINVNILISFLNLLVKEIEKLENEKSED